MPAIKCLSFTIVQYAMLVMGVFMAALLIGVGIKRLNRTAGISVMIIVSLLFVYFAILETPAFDFFGQVTNKVRTQEHLVALTFDDGPSAKYTPRILDILKHNGAHATFFVTGENAERNPRIIRRIVAEGHQLGNHTYSHAFFFRKMTNSRKKEILKTDDIIFRITGEHMKYFRAPYEYRDVRLVELLKKLNYEYISHDVSSLDAMGAGSKKIVSQILKESHSGAIILLHDARGNREPTVEALETALPLLREKGFRTVTIDELRAAGN